MRLTTAQRLAAAIALAVLLVSGLALGAQYLLVKRDLLHRQEALLRADLDGFAALYDQRRVIAVRQAIEHRKLTGAEGALVLMLLDRDGTLLAGTLPDWPAEVAKQPEDRESGARILTVDGQDYLAVSRTFSGGFPFLVARSTAPDEATLAVMRRIILFALLAIALVAALIGQVASRWILRKITRLNALSDRVAAGDLAARIDTPAQADEFGALQDRFHHMLDRIEALNRATHHLSDTVAHELRTPLTRIQARLSRLAAGEDTEALQGEIRSTIRIFDSLLEIARAETEGGARAMLSLDLSGLLAEVCELYEPLAETREIGFATDIAADVTVLGDRNLIAQLISNLLENALKFTPAGERVTVALSPGATHHLMRIEDSGRGLPPGFEAQIFDRFTRADPDGTAPGHGLGLALVKAVALRHGAKLCLPETEKGFSIEIAWPKIVET